MQWRLGRVQPRFQTPGAAILLATTLGVVFVTLRTFEQLADTFVTAIIPFYALGVAVIFSGLIFYPRLNRTSVR